LGFELLVAIRMEQVEQRSGQHAQGTQSGPTAADLLDAQDYPAPDALQAVGGQKELFAGFQEITQIGQAVLDQAGEVGHGVGIEVRGQAGFEFLEGLLRSFKQLAHLGLVFGIHVV
jgi:hypothetical protein